MKKKKILITGASGVIGSVFTEYYDEIYDIYPIYNTHEINHKNKIKCNLENKDEIKNIIKNIRPDIIIHCAGEKNVKLIEDNYDLGYKKNVIYTENIISSEINNTLFIYISTDYVFDGKKGLYKETDEANPSTKYGITKKMAEEIIINNVKKYIIVRTAAVMSKKSQFLNFIIQALKENRTEYFYNNLFFSPTDSDALTNYISYLIDNEIYNDIFHITNNIRLSRYDIAKYIGELFNKSELIKPKECVEQNILLPIDSSLSSDKIIRLTNKIFDLFDYIKKIKEYLWNS